MRTVSSLLALCVSGLFLEACRCSEEASQPAAASAGTAPNAAAPQAANQAEPAQAPACHLAGESFQIAGNAQRPTIRTGPTTYLATHRCRGAGCGGQGVSRVTYASHQVEAVTFPRALTEQRISLVATATEPTSLACGMGPGGNVACDLMLGAEARAIDFQGCSGAITGIQSVGRPEHIVVAVAATGCGLSLASVPLAGGEVQTRQVTPLDVTHLNLVQSPDGIGLTYREGTTRRSWVANAATLETREGRGRLPVLARARARVRDGQVFLRGRTDRPIVVPNGPVLRAFIDEEADLRLLVWSTAQGLFAAPMDVVPLPPGLDPAQAPGISLIGPPLQIATGAIPSFDFAVANRLSIGVAWQAGRNVQGAVIDCGTPDLVAQAPANVPSGGTVQAGTAQVAALAPTPVTQNTRVGNFRAIIARGSVVTVRELFADCAITMEGEVYCGMDGPIMFGAPSDDVTNYPQLRGASEVTSTFVTGHGGQTCARVGERVLCAAGPTAQAAEVAALRGVRSIVAVDDGVCGVRDSQLVCGATEPAPTLPTAPPITSIMAADGMGAFCVTTTDSRVLCTGVTEHPEWYGVDSSAEDSFVQSRFQLVRIEQRGENIAGWTASGRQYVLPTHILDDRNRVQDNAPEIRCDTGCTCVRDADIDVSDSPGQAWTCEPGDHPRAGSLYPVRIARHRAAVMMNGSLVLQPDPEDLIGEDADEGCCSDEDDYDYSGEDYGDDEY